ncbi:MAG: hypothetical protein ACR2GP_07095 [Burkholderiaceae bacterium]
MQVTEGRIDAVFAPQSYAAIATEQLVEVDGAQIRAAVRVPEGIDEMDVVPHGTGGGRWRGEGSGKHRSLQRGPLSQRVTADERVVAKCRNDAKRQFRTSIRR